MWEHNEGEERVQVEETGTSEGAEGRGIERGK